MKAYIEVNVIFCKKSKRDIPFKVVGEEEEKEEKVIKLSIDLETIEMFGEDADNNTRSFIGLTNGDRFLVQEDYKELRYRIAKIGINMNNTMGA